MNIGMCVALFEEAPPELISDVMQGAYFLWWGSSIKNLDVVLSETLNVSVVIGRRPAYGVVRGCAKY